MITRILIPILAIAGFVFGLYMVAEGNRPVAAAAAVAVPAVSPFDSAVSGSGLVESASRNIAVATPVSGLVTEVAVNVGDVVRRGDVLFRLDDRQLRAERLTREAAVQTSVAELARLQAFPRAEDVPPVEAAVQQAMVALDDARARLSLVDDIADKGAVSEEELIQRRFAVKSAEATLAARRADLDRVRVGTFVPEIETARARLAEARASLAQIDIELDRLVVTAPIDGTILQRNIQPGEFAQAGVLTTPHLLLGDVSALHVRVDIDENDAWRFSPSTEAFAYLRGNKQLSTPLQFVRIEPFVIPKRSLTGDTTERVDTRVLQVVYRFDPGVLPARVGQMMDVYIQDSAPATSTQKGTNPL